MKRKQPTPQPSPPKKITNRGTTSVDELIGNRIRARRMEQGCSQQDLGDALGVSFQQIQKYEKGVNRVGVARLQSIAAYLKTDMDYFTGDLISDAGNKRSPTVSRFANFMATKDGVDIVEAMMKIDNPAQRRIIIQLVRGLGNADAA